MTQPDETCWGVVIETDSYAGNFERALCAHCTGRVGACGAGSELAAIEIAEQFQNVKEVADDNGCWRPVTLWGPKGEDVLIYFEEKPTEEQVELIKQRLETFPGPDPGFDWNAIPKFKRVSVRYFEVTRTEEEVS